MTLFDKELANSTHPVALNSARLTGQVVFESPNVFTITPKEDKSLYLIGGDILNKTIDNSYTPY